MGSWGFGCNCCFCFCGVGGAAVGASVDENKAQREREEDKKETNLKISNLTQAFQEQETSLKSEITKLRDEIKSLEKQIEAFQKKEKTNFNDRIVFNEKQIISNYDNGIEMQAKIVLLFETTLKFLQKKLELIREKRNNQDSDIMVVSMSSNSSLGERISQNNGHFDDALSDEEIQTQEEIKKQQKLLEIEQKRIIYEPSRKMIFELAEEVRNNQIEVNKVRDEKEKTELISKNAKVKEIFEVLKIENNIEKKVVFVGA